jgi:hypothetical protein
LDAQLIRWLVSVERRLVALQDPRNDVPESVKMVLAGFSLDLADIQVAILGVQSTQQRMGEAMGDLVPRISRLERDSDKPASK